MSNPITQSRLKELLRYNPDTGYFFAIIPQGSYLTGDRVGSVIPNRLTKVMVDCKCCKAHDLVWIYMFGYPPMNPMEYLDGDVTNDAFANLREWSFGEKKRYDEAKLRNEKRRN